MSAWLVSDEGLLVMTYAALNAQHGLRWSWGPRDEYAPSRQGRIARCDYDAADRVVRMLRTENVRSLAHRYPEHPEDWADLAVLSYPPTLAFTKEPTPVEVLKTIACYEYQSCEHPEWHESEARAFCGSLRLEAIHHLPGYDDAAGWDWTVEEFTTRRGGAICLSGLIPRKGRT